jgi:hypothetical protein
MEDAGSPSELFPPRFYSLKLPNADFKQGELFGKVSIVAFDLGEFGTVLQRNQKEEYKAREECQIYWRVKSQKSGGPLQRLGENADDERQYSRDKPPDGMPLAQASAPEHLHNQSQSEHRSYNSHNVLQRAH